MRKAVLLLVLLLCVLLSFASANHGNADVAMGEEPGYPDDGFMQQEQQEQQEQQFQEPESVEQPLDQPAEAEAYPMEMEQADPSGVDVENHQMADDQANANKVPWTETAAEYAKKAKDLAVKAAVVGGEYAVKGAKAAVEGVKVVGNHVVNFAKETHRKLKESSNKEAVGAPTTTTNSKVPTDEQRAALRKLRPQRKALKTATKQTKMLTSQLNKEQQRQEQVKAELRALRPMRKQLAKQQRDTKFQLKQANKQQQSQQPAGKGMAVPPQSSKLARGGKGKGNVPLPVTGAAAKQFNKANTPSGRGRGGQRAQIKPQQPQAQAQRPQQKKNNRNNRR